MFDIHNLVDGPSPGIDDDDAPGNARSGSNAGRDIRAQYEFMSELGKGAYGVVTKARHRATDAIFAVKEVDKRAAGAKGLSSVFSEVEILSVLHHPSIVHLEEIFEDGNSLWLVLEYVAGGELDAELRQHGFFPETTCRRIIGHLLLAAEYIHGKSIVHRDLKPANMLVSGRLADGGNCELKLADFGFSCVVSNEATLTSFCGTTTFMAPEIIADAPYGKPVDMWAVGVITFLLVTGAPPFAADRDSELADAICDGRVSWPDRRYNGRPPPSEGCVDFVTRLLHVDAASRLSATEAVHHWWIRGGPGGGAELDLYGDDDARADAAAGGGAAQSTGRRHPRLRWRKAGYLVRAAHRLLFWQRCGALRAEGCDIPLLRSFSFLVGRAWEPCGGHVPVAGCLPTDRSVQRVCDMVAVSRTAESWDLSHNALSYESVQAVVRAAGVAPRLTSLNLSHTPVTTLGGRALMRLARGGKLRHIHLKGTQISAEVLQQIEQALREKDRAAGALQHSTGRVKPGSGHPHRAALSSPGAGDAAPFAAAARASRGVASPAHAAQRSAAQLHIAMRVSGSAAAPSAAPSLFAAPAGSAGAALRAGGARHNAGATPSLPRIAGGGGGPVSHVSCRPAPSPRQSAVKR